MADLFFVAEIAAPANLVAAFFVPQRMPYWYGPEMEMAFDVEGGAADFRAGQKVRIVGRLGGREVTLTVVVAEYEFGRRLEWRFQDSFGVRGTQRWEIEPVGEASRVRMRDSYQMPGALGRSLDRIFTRHAVARRDRAWLARLKQLAERAPRSA